MLTIEKTGMSIPPEPWGMTVATMADRFAITLTPDEKLTQEVALHAMLWDRDKHPLLDPKTQYAVPATPENPVPQLGDAILIAGGLTTELDSINLVVPLGAQHQRVAVIAHPEAQTSRVQREPLNDQDYSVSGYAFYKSVKELVDAEKLQPGLTGYAHSAGCAELLWATAYDSQAAKADPNYKRIINNIVLMAPAGIVDVGDIKQLLEGVRKGSQPIIKDLASIVFGGEIPVKPGYGQRLSPLKARPALTQLAKATPRSFDTLIKNIIIASKQPWGTSVKTEHVLFEIAEFLLQHTLVTKRLLQAFHVLWPDQTTILGPTMAHKEPEGQSYKKMIELVPQAKATEQARNMIEKTNIVVVLFDRDEFFPPRAYLTPQEIRNIDGKTTLDTEGIELLIRTNEHTRENFEKENQERIQRGQRPVSRHVFSKHLLTEQDMLRAIQAEKEEDIIIPRIKTKFPHRSNTVRVLIAHDSSHLAPYRFHPEELFGASARRLNPQKVQE